MGLILRSVFYYLKEALNIEKYFENKTKVRTCFILVFIVILLSNLALQHFTQVFAKDVDVQNINVILSNVSVFIEQNGVSDLDKITSFVKGFSEPFITHLKSFVINNFWMVILTYLLPIVVFIVSMFVIIKYLMYLIAELRRKGVKDTFVLTYFNDEYPTSEEQISRKFGKDFFKYFLLILCSYLLITLFASGATILPIILNVIFTRILFFTILFNICFDYKFSEALGRGVKVFGLGFFKITLNLLIFTLLAQIVQSAVVSFGSLLHYKEAVTVIGSFVASLLTFVEAKFYMHIFVDTYFGIPKIKEENTEL